MRYRYAWIRWISTFALAILCTTQLARASAEDTQSTLGFEDASDWTVENGTIVGLTTTRTQGDSALVVRAPGYTILESRAMGPLGDVFPSLSFDLMLPNIQPPPSWQGAAQLFVSVPSQGVYNAFLGQRELTGLEPGVFHRMHFSVPDEILASLRASYSDLYFSVALNAPSGVSSDEYIIDNLEVSATIPQNTTAANDERLSILGFETEDAWQATGGSIAGLSWFNSSQGNFALAFRPQGYAVLESRLMPSIGPVDSTFSLDIRLPAEQPNPNWYGALQLYFSIPSRGIYNFYVDQVDMTGFPVDETVTARFHPSQEALDLLNSNTAQVRFGLAFNVPQNTLATYFVDNFQLGPLTKPPAVLPSDTPIRRDLVGLASSGMMNIAAHGDSASPPLTLGALYVEEESHTCIPTASTACRYIVHLARFRVGAFTLLGKDFSGVSIFNEDPFEVVIGGDGPASLTSAIPSNVLFAIVIEGTDKGFSAFPGSRSSVTISPAGAGMLAFTAALHATVDGHAVDFDFSVVADSPLANRPPVAVATAIPVIMQGTCEAKVVLEGGLSSDPDDNLLLLDWREGDLYWGSGATLNATLYESGSHLVTLRAVDRFGSFSQQGILVRVELPPGCP